jgi:HAD superfamily hydrolase (TIGR01490 family)
LQRCGVLQKRLAYNRNPSKFKMRAAFFDVDGTLTVARVWRGMMEYFKRHNQRRMTHLAFLATHYPLYFIRRLGLISESNFRRPWAAHLAWYLRGMTAQETQEIWQWVTETFLQNGGALLRGGHVDTYWRMDSRALLENHLRAGDPVVLVSSGPQPLIQQIGLELGTEHAIGTSLETRDGLFTGRSLQPICIDAYKARMAREYLQSKGFQVDYSKSYTYADSTSDLHLLEMVGHPVAVHPDETLRAIASQRGWRIIPA